MIGSKLTKRYGKALFDIGREDKSYEKYGKDLQAFSDLCTGSPEFLDVLSNKVFSLENRKHILETILARSEFSAVVKNFLRLLLEKNRIRAIPGITDYYARLTDESLNIKRAVVVTAQPLKKGAVQKLEKALTDLTSKKIKMRIEEDRSLIGGVVVKIGDLVLDGSVRAQLEGLKESLKRGEYI